MTRRLISTMLLFWVSALPVFGETFNFENRPPKEIVESLLSKMGHRLETYAGPEDPVSFSFRGSPEDAFKSFLETNNMRSTGGASGTYVKYFPPLPQSIQNALNDGKNLELYSIYPDGGEFDPSLVKGEIFGYRYLGKVTLDQEEREKTKRSLRDLIERGFFKARCFIPRHLLIVDDSVTFVVCFECLYIKAYDEDGEHRIEIGQDHGYFNEVLQSHGIPLAPEI